MRHSGDAKAYAAALPRSPWPLAARRCRNAATNNVLLRSWIVAEPAGLQFISRCAIAVAVTANSLCARETLVQLSCAQTTPLCSKPGAKSELVRATCACGPFAAGANCNYRYRKNRRPGIWAATLILVRAGERSGRWGLRMLYSTLLTPFSFRRARHIAWMGILDLCFAWGCIAPYFGVRSKKYYSRGSERREGTMTARIALVVEWDNARLSEVDRAREMLRRLCSQATQAARRSNQRSTLRWCTTRKQLRPRFRRLSLPSA